MSAPALPPIPVPVAHQAVAWMLDLQSDTATDALRRDWQHWLNQHPDHARAWQRIESVNRTLQRAAMPAQTAIAHATLTPPRSPRRRQIIQATAALALLTGAAGARHYLPWPVWLADYRTAVGERRRLAWADGTTVDMNTDSVLNVNIGPHIRRLQLLAGEILVTATAHPTHPVALQLDTPHGTLHTDAAQFAVRHWPHHRTDVQVVAAHVAVTSHATGATTTLGAGQQLQLWADGATAPVPFEAIAPAWIDGFLIAQGMRLDDFLAELARHHRQTLACDPAIANLRVSGVYPLNDLGRILDTLRIALPIRVETLTRPWGTATVRLRATDAPVAI